MPATRPLADRLADLTRKDPDGCWRFLGEKRHGYGYIHQTGTGRALRAHRVAYELSFGPIPDELVVMHSCDVRSCVNPAHLSLGTPADNHRDMREKGRAVMGRTKQENCDRGHPMKTEKSGRRRCPICENARLRAARQGLTLDEYLADAWPVWTSVKTW